MIGDGWLVGPGGLHIHTPLCHAGGCGAAGQDEPAAHTIDLIGTVYGRGG